MDHLLTLRAFCRVASSGSFTQAARELSLAQSAVSRGIASLEERLGLQLFERSTRRVALTIEGRAFLGQVEEHVRGLEDAELRASSGFADIAGRVRIAAPAALGRALLLPELTKMMQDSPGLKVDITFTDRRIDLAKAGIDFAVRVGAGTEPAFVERRIAPSPQWFVVAPHTFAGRSTPKSIEDLQGAPVAVSGGARELERLGVDVRFTADDLEATLAATLAGVGLSLLPRWLVAPSVRRGELLRLLPQVEVPSPPVVVVHPRRLRRLTRQVLERVAPRLGAQLEAGAGATVDGPLPQAHTP